MKSINWKVLLLSFIAQFLITMLLHLGLRTPQMLSFLSVSGITAKTADLINPVFNIDPFDQIKLKLEEKKDQFELKKTTSFVAPAQASSDYDNAKAYIAVDYNSGEVLAAKESDKPISIASLTKIMTAVVALDLAKQQDLFTVSGVAAAQQPTKIGVVEGQKMSLEELLNAALMTSANDAVEVIRDGIDQKYLPAGRQVGSGVFIKAMNEKAKIIGLKNTHFENPQGLDNNNHYSSAEDLATLTHYALTNYPLISEITKKDYQFLPANVNHKQFDLYNWNGLLGVYPGVMGVKIGNTGDASYTTVVVSEREGKKVIAVLLGAPGVLERDLWTGELLDTGFEKLGLSPILITESQLKAKYSTWKYWE